MVELNEVWLVDYARTAFSRSRPGQPERDVFGEIRGDELLVLLLQKMFEDKLANKGIEKKDIDEFTVGSAFGVGEHWTYGGKLPTWFAGMDVHTSSVFLDKQCGSAAAGFHLGFLEIASGYSKCVLSTGLEHLTRVPMGITNQWIRPNLSIAKKDSPFYVQKFASKGEYDLLVATDMLSTAQKLFEEEIPRFTKEDMDKFGVRSHNLTIKSQEEKFFTSGVNGGEIIPIQGHVEGNVEEPLMVDRDMAARKSTLEGVAGLRPVSKPHFVKKTVYGEELGRKGYEEYVGSKDGVITAGNASPLNAGATACVMMDAKEAEKRGINPLAKILSIGFAGVDPTVMGRGPVPASKMALQHAALTVDDIDFWEINEAFCIVALNCMDKLGIPEERVNVMGGSTAIGHPLGATMCRLIGSLARILKHKNGKYGIANACVGGGQGVAVLLENPSA
ncbi:MAG: acetyl-CoA C-acyltransferase [Promethearchaeota archaeon]